MFHGIILILAQNKTNFQDPPLYNIQLHFLQMKILAKTYSGLEVAERKHIYIYIYAVVGLGKRIYSKKKKKKSLFSGLPLQNCRKKRVIWKQILIWESQICHW